MNGEKRILCIWLLLVLVNVVSANTGAASIPAQMSEMTDLNNGLKNVAAALGVLVITHAGLRWIMSEGAQERDDAKKTIIYVIVGLIIVSTSEDLTNALYKPVTGCLAE